MSGHYITRVQTTHQTDETTMSDHCTVLGETPDVKIEVTTAGHSKIRTTNLKKKHLRRQKRLKKLDVNNLNQREQISRCISECIERFAPEQEIKTKKPTAWNTKTVKIAFTERDQPFPNWTKSLSENNRQKYIRTTECDTKGYERLQL